jgi:endonuclease YncB( thermonuclease family)
MIRLGPRLALAALCLLAWGAPLAALDRDGAGRVTAVPAGDMVALEDGAQVRLVGIRAPGRAQPLAEAARTALSDMLLGRTVALSYGGTRTDRHGRRLAHLHLAEGDGAGLWAQGEMLRRPCRSVRVPP